MRMRTLIVAGIAVAGVGAIAYAAAPARTAAPASRAVEIRSAYNPFTLSRVTVAQRASVAQAQAARVRPPHRPPPRSYFRPPGRGPWFEPPGPPPNTGGPGGNGP